MPYELEIKAEPMKFLRSLPVNERKQTGYRPNCLQRDFSGDVTKLRGSRNEYRLRVGDWRVLFELVGDQIVVYAIGDRKDIYK
jgi:mRNA interferase RelE/StbE